ncbi:hypothetical protein ADK38_29035 [Streptomyces varsoviensis]|uniref:Uncharacterized protein n=1 Tax=Streptomyces varsoviensis TaxID=67373 RepID=A0ABR5J076_9ACTN|nr:hypothetical protein ADK38_29035 [Streptomyces varsoviensis]
MLHPPVALTVQYTVHVLAHAIRARRLSALPLIEAAQLGGGESQRLQSGAQRLPVDQRGDGPRG